MKSVLVLVGGKSGEHEVSLISGKHVLQALDLMKFKPLLVVIQKDGQMERVAIEELQKISNNPKEVKPVRGEPVAVRPYRGTAGSAALVSKQGEEVFDVVFPLIHGPGGEDGTIQGMFEFASVPVVGCGVRSSSICMDKAVTKTLCLHARLPVVQFRQQYRGESFAGLAWKYPVFVKPARLGSSLGVSKVKSAGELEAAITEAFKWDDKIMFEPGVQGREIEVAILGTRQEMIVSVPGEIRPKDEFYSYEAKYVKDDGAELLAPAPLTPEQVEKVQGLAKEIFKTLECSGMARLDFFLTPDDHFLLNEVNTIPGFTPISMYPKLMQLSGITYSDLVTRLIELAD